MSQYGRRDWEESDIQALMDLWPRVMSIYLIALTLKRSPSSIQTMASRKNLPRRSEGNERNRLKWSADDLTLLREALTYHMGDDGEIYICEIAEEMGRSIDAVAARLIEIEEIGSEKALLERVVISEKYAITSSTRQSKQGGQRPCLTCREIFWSEGSHNKMCGKCRKDTDSSDWDFYF